MDPLQYGCVTEFCTPQECPVMCAGPRFEYHWQDGVRYKKPTKMSAPGALHALGLGYPVVLGTQTDEFRPVDPQSTSTT